jgi:hypothetical protein
VLALIFGVEVEELRMVFEETWERRKGENRRERLKRRRNLIWISRSLSGET